MAEQPTAPLEGDEVLILFGGKSDVQKRMVREVQRGILSLPVDRRTQIEDFLHFDRGQLTGIARGTRAVTYRDYEMLQGYLALNIVGVLGPPRFSPGSDQKARILRKLGQDPSASFSMDPQSKAITPEEMFVMGACEELALHDEEPLPFAEVRLHETGG